MRIMLVLAGLALVVGGCTRAEETTAPRATPRPAATEATSTPGSTPTPNPDRVTAAGTPLVSVDEDPVSGDGCDALRDPGWDEGDCAFVQLGGGEAAAVWERRATQSVLGLWRVTVFVRTQAGWAPELRAEGEPDLWGELTARAVDLSGPTLAIGYRYGGSGSLLDYDVLTWPDGGELHVEAHRAGLSHGSVRFDGGRITDYSADYPNNEPNCCPPRFAETVIVPEDGGFVITTGGFVEPEDVPGSEL